MRTTKWQKIEKAKTKKQCPVFFISKKSAHECFPCSTLWMCYRTTRENTYSQCEIRTNISHSQHATHSLCSFASLRKQWSNKNISLDIESGNKRRKRRLQEREITFLNNNSLSSDMLWSFSNIETNYATSIYINEVSRIKNWKKRISIINLSGEDRKHKLDP